MLPSLQHAGVRRSNVSAIRTAQRSVYRRPVEEAEVGIWVVDDAGVTTYVNSKMAQMLGYTPREMRGRILSSFTDKPCSATFHHTVKRRERGALQQAVFQFKRKDGTLIGATVACVPMFSGDEYCGAYALVSSRTEGRAREAATRRVGRDPEKGEKHRTAKLAEANRRLRKEIAARKKAESELMELYRKETGLTRRLQEESRKRVDYVLAMVHELRTPLTAIVATSELLKAEATSEPLSSLAESIHRSGCGLHTRVEELLDLGRCEAGILRLRESETDPSAMLRKVVEDMQSAAKKKKQSLGHRLPERLPTMLADEIRLRQVMMNLLDNAVKFTPQGGQIVVGARERRGWLEVEVADTGPGIAPELHRDLFEPYARLKTEKGRLSGLGIGLALCKGLVELHGGRIWARNRKTGATFGFTIRIKTPPP